MRKKPDRAEFECFSDCGSAKRAANRRCHQGEAQAQKEEEGDNREQSVFEDGANRGV